VQEGHEFHQGVLAGANDEPGQVHAGDFDFAFLREGKAARTAGGQFDNKPDHGQRLVADTANAESADFKQTGQFHRRMCNQAAMARFKHDAVVGDKPGEWNLPLSAGIEER
jgi:hypothetical protein